MRWVIVCVLLIIAVPAWAENNKNDVTQPSESSEWNQKMCPNGVENMMGKMIEFIQLNPYDSKGRCFNYFGSFIQLLNKHQAFYSLLTNTTPFAMVDFGKDSAPKGLFNGVVKGKGAYSYQTASGMQNIIFSFVPVPKSKAREAWDRKQENIKKLKEEAEANAQAKIEQEWDRNPTYTDPTSGLMWARNGNIADKIMQMDEADLFVKKLSYGGFNDWRLPTKEELEAFTRRGGRFPPEWFNNNGFRNVLSRYYWTASGGWNGTKSFAWDISVDNGFASHYFTSAGGYVWPVRVGQ